MRTIKITIFLMVIALTQTSQLKTQDWYDQAKKSIQAKIHDAQRDYPTEYQAAKTGFAYGALAGAIKSLIPGVPKRGKGFMSCTFIGAVVGGCTNVALDKNASPLMNFKEKLEYMFSDEGQKKLSAQMAQAAVESIQDSPDVAKNDALEKLTTINNEQSEQNKEDKDISDEERAALFKKIACLTAFLFA